MYKDMKGKQVIQLSMIFTRVEILIKSRFSDEGLKYKVLCSKIQIKDLP